LGVIAAEANDKVPILETNIVHTQAGIRYRIIQTPHPGTIRYILIGLSIEPLDRLTPVVAAVVGIEVAVVVNVTVGVWVGTSVGVPVGVLVGGWGVEVEVGGTGVCVLVAGIEVLVGGGAIVSGSFDAESVPEQAAVAMVRAIKINRINL
jgi:hypothetical protein